jgi:hypothetical protein
MLDNASSNDVCVTLLCENLCNSAIPMSPKVRRLRCAGHIINLVVKAMLFGTEADAFELEAEALHELQDETRELELWRRRGPVGKLHNLVTYIRRTPQRIEEFTRSQHNLIGHMDHQNLQLLADNATRWNSTYNMISRAMKLRDPLDLFMSRPKNQAMLQQDELNDDDWEQLTHILSLLQPFEALTKRLQGRAINGREGSVWEILPAMELLLQHLEVNKSEYEYSEHPYLTVSVNNAWKKLDKYYSLTELSPVYVAAVVLNPKVKWFFFEQKWRSRPDWITAAKTAVQSMWEQFYKDQESRLGNPKPAATVDGDLDMLDEFLITDEANLGFQELPDEYTEYCNLKSDSRIADIIQWWQDHASTYPRLFQMACDILSIPAMSAECERVFSSAKLMLPDTRNRLKEDIIEASECLKSWSKLNPMPEHAKAVNSGPSR